MRKIIKKLKMKLIDEINLFEGCNPGKINSKCSRI